ncbi:MAG: DUF5127 domain-containing protein, partial [Streptomycetaceae bacterium]|nr:DUF5127 domain-containing protein [Streptomycetaceae bacterium]
MPAESGFTRRDLLRYTELAGAAAAAAWLFPASAAAGAAYSPLRPPATPLAVRSMYLSSWLPGDTLPGRWATFWNGKTTGLTGIAVIDGTAHLFAGAPAAPSLPALEQTALTVTATRSVFELAGGGIKLTVTFLSPVDPANLTRQSVPLSYVSLQAASLDGAEHRVSLYVDITGEWAHGDHTQPIDWTHQICGSQHLLSFAATKQTPISEHDEQAGWGTVVLATDSGDGVTWQVGTGDAVRGAAIRGPLACTALAGPRRIDDSWPVFAVRRDLPVVTPAAPSAEMVLSIGHVRTPAVRYLGASLDPWWRTKWNDWPAMVDWFRSDYAAAREHCERLDDRIDADAARIFGADNAVGRQYAAVCALALRQTLAGTELVNRHGVPWAMLKEISSNGNMCTVDVIYPAMPALLYLAPDYLRLLLEPLLDYVEAGHWPRPFAPHDLGVHYPDATGHSDGGGENMPIEESANMLIMTAAVVGRLSRDAGRDAAARHYSVLRGWADYLVGHALHPDFQNQTDDFTGFIARSSNLALKGIIGIGAMALIARAAGHSDDATRYSTTAHKYVGEWVKHSKDPSGQHLMLAYGKPGTWSLKYNGFADRLLRLGLIPADVAAKEAAWYTAHAGAYGVPLDHRHSYTKTDWQLWAAGFLLDHPAARDLFIDRVYRFADATGDRAPFTDWYDVNTGAQQATPDGQSRFTARPVIGGVFAVLALGCTTSDRMSTARTTHE